MFRRSLQLLLMAASDFSCNFFRILTSRFEQWVGAFDWGMSWFQTWSWLRTFLATILWIYRWLYCQIQILWNQIPLSCLFDCPFCSLRHEISIHGPLLYSCNLIFIPWMACCLSIPHCWWTDGTSCSLIADMPDFSMSPILFQNFYPSEGDLSWLA